MNPRPSHSDAPPSPPQTKNAASEFRQSASLFKSLLHYFITSLLCLSKSQPRNHRQFSDAFFLGVNGGNGVFGPSGFGVTTVSGFPGSSIRTMYW